MTGMQSKMPRHSNFWRYETNHVWWHSGSWPSLLAITSSRSSQPFSQESKLCRIQHSIFCCLEHKELEVFSGTTKSGMCLKLENAVQCTWSWPHTFSHQALFDVDTIEWCKWCLFMCSQILYYSQVCSSMYTVSNDSFLCRWVLWVVAFEVSRVFGLLTQFGILGCDGALVRAGDFGEENVELVRDISNLDFPKAVILGNHDAWWSTYKLIHFLLTSLPDSGLKLQLTKCSWLHFDLVVQRAMHMFMRSWIASLFCVLLVSCLTVFNLHPVKGREMVSRHSWICKPFSLVEIGCQRFVACWEMRTPGL